MYDACIELADFPFICEMNTLLASTRLSFLTEPHTGQWSSEEVLWESGKGYTYSSYEIVSQNHFYFREDIYYELELESISEGPIRVVYDSENDRMTLSTWTKEIVDGDEHMTNLVMQYRMVDEASYYVQLFELNMQTGEGHHYALYFDKIKYDFAYRVIESKEHLYEMPLDLMVDDLHITSAVDILSTGNPIEGFVFKEGVLTNTY